MLPISTNQGELFQIKRDLSVFLKPFFNQDEDSLIALLERPKNESWGQLALPIFSLSGKTPPQDFARNVSQEILKKKEAWIRDIDPKGGFVNFTFESNYLREHIINTLSKKDLSLFPSSAKEHWVIDFASPNVAKPMSAGHLRATVLGQVLVNLCRSFGIQVTSINHLGDWGTQFGKLIWAYQKWGNSEPDSMESFLELYIRFHKESKKNPKIEDEAREIFKKLESGDQELRDLWSRFVKISLDEYNKYWKILNVKHDLTQGESFYNSMVEDLYKRIRDLGFLQKSEGAEVVFLDDMPPCLIRKSDGASTYATRDIASAIYRFSHLKSNRNIYITGSDHKLHFKQLFATLKKIDSDAYSASEHFSFGMYRFKGKGKMSTREGRVIYLKDIIDETTKQALKIIQERSPHLKSQEEKARQVAIGAILFNDLSVDRLKDVDFDWSRILDFEGRTGPFVQYTRVRCLSLIKKSQYSPGSRFSKLFQKKAKRHWFGRCLGLKRPLCNL